MSLIDPGFDFSVPDFDSIKSRVSSAVQSVFSYWTNFIRPTLNNVLLEAFCFNHDVLMWYLDRRIRETRMSSATLRESVENLSVWQHGYRPQTNVAATTAITLSIDETVAGDVSIANGTAIATQGSNQIIGQLDGAQTITAGTTTVSGTWEHSTTRTESFTGTGKPDQEFELAYTPFVWGSISFSDASGAWTRVDDFSKSTSSSKHYKVEVSSDSYANIICGDGTNGDLPTGSVMVEYKTGGGEDGNVSAETLISIDGSFSDSFGTPVTVRVSNASAATGGTDQETIEEIKRNSLASYKAQSRSVSRPDSEGNIETLTSVARVLLMTVDQDSGIDENTGHYYLVGFGEKTNSGRYKPLVATGSMKSDAETIVNTTYPTPVTFINIVQDTSFNDIDYSLSIEVEDGFVFANVAENIYNALDDFHAVALSDDDDKAANTEVGFGYNVDNALQWHKFFNICSSVSGVKQINEDTFTPTNTVVLEDEDFPRLGTVTITDIDSGTVLSW